MRNRRFRLARHLQLLRLHVSARRFEACRGERFTSRQPLLRHRRIAQGEAHSTGELAHGGQHVGLARRVVFERVTNRAVRADAADADLIAGALRLDLAGDDRADAFANGDQFRSILVEFRSLLDGGCDPEGIAPRVRADERRTFDAEANRLLDDAVEHRITGFVVEVANQHRDRIVRSSHRRATARQIPACRGAREDDDHRRGGELRSRRRVVDDHLMDVRADRSVRHQAIERGHERGGRLVAVIGIRRQQLHDDGVDRLRDLRVDLARRFRRGRHALEQLRHRVVAVGHPHRPSDEHVVHHQAERILIGAAIDLLPLRLLRRHVLERADHRARQRLRGAVLDRSRDAEIHNQRIAAGRHRILGCLLEHDVLGLEVAVHHPLLVRGREALGDLLRDLDHPIGRQDLGPAKNLRQRLALDERHRQVLDAVDLAEVVDADDVLVRDLAGQHQLALESQLEIFRRGGVRLREGSNHLDRNRHAELVIECLVHGAHAAGAEQFQDRVARSDLLPRRERPIPRPRRRTR